MKYLYLLLAVVLGGLSGVVFLHNPLGGLFIAAVSVYCWIGWMERNDQSRQVRNEE